MATIKTRSRKITVIDGAAMEAAHDVGVLFGCLSAVCGKCATTVKSGLNNLTPATAEEKAMGLEPGRRLMCQCRRNKGTVVLDID